MRFFFTKNRKQGFTLLELLVVIAVIGILSSLVMYFLGDVRINSRNNRRNEDIRQLMNAFNLGLLSNSSFPNTGGSYICVSSSCSGLLGNNTDPLVDSFISPFMPTKPNPLSGGNLNIVGYYFINKSGFTSSLYDGSPMQDGAYLYWKIERSNKESCGKGIIYFLNRTGVECALKLD